jgi:hypothetical protein
MGWCAWTDSRFRVALACAGVCAHAGLASAAVVSLTPVADNTVYYDVDAELSNGRGSGIFVGKTALERERRGVLKFDVSSIPAGAVVNSVTLTMRVTRSASEPQPIDVRRATSAWGEGTSVASGNGGRGATPTAGDCTWTYAMWQSTPWNTPGGDFVAQVSATQIVSGLGSYSWSDVGLASDVQAWVNGSAANFGWFLLGNETAPITTKRFASRENTNASYRPTIVVDYTPVPTPGASALGLCVTAFALGRRRR